MRSMHGQGVAALALLGGCGLEALHAEFQATEPPTSAGVGSSGSSGAPVAEASSSSSGGEAAGEASQGETSSSSGDSTAAHEAGEASSSSETSGPASVCGDGIVGAGEECDDGNDDDLDACDNACAAAWTIFVTSTTYTGNFNGTVGADTRCINRAGNGGLPRYLEYRALVSDSTSDAADRLHHARGWYKLVNGLPVAHGWEQLVHGPLVNPVEVTELSTTAKVGVWTGSLPGAIKVPGALHCADWKDEDLDAGGHWGVSFEVESTWLYWNQPETNPTSCIAPQALYCVEQP